MELKWALFCILASMLALGNSENWMAGGNFTQEEFGILRAKVDNFNKGLTSQNMGPAAKAMSDDLNTLWHPAWNVFIVYYHEGNYDSVLYGYAFRLRWFWFNGFQLTNGFYISFIIWKDFNCVTWTTYDPATNPQSTSYSKAVDSSILSTMQSDNALNVRSLSDIWKAAQHMQSKVPTASDTLLQDPLGYTIIVSQTSVIEFYARFCASGFARVFNIGKLNGIDDGGAFILQMRSS